MPGVEPIKLFPVGQLRVPVNDATIYVGRVAADLTAETLQGGIEEKGPVNFAFWTGNLVQPCCWRLTRPQVLEQDVHHHQIAVKWKCR